LPRFSIIFFLLALCSHGAAALDGGRARLDRFLAELTSFTATFEQQLFDEYGELIETSRGDVVIAKPGKFRWEYRAPYEQIIVSDGATLWVYDVDLEQVSINPLANDNPDSAAALLVGDTDVDSHYVVTEAPAIDGITWLSLAPRAAQAQYRSVEIGFDEQRLHGMRLSDNLRQLTAITFSDIARNVAIDPERFAFTPPPGVDVLTNTGARPAAAP
jgi:outer membrane lipoprotein carrier protein